MVPAAMRKVDVVLGETNLKSGRQLESLATYMWNSDSVFLPVPSLLRLCERRGQNPCQILALSCIPRLSGASTLQRKLSLAVRKLQTPRSRRVQMGPCRGTRGRLYTLRHSPRFLATSKPWANSADKLQRSAGVCDGDKNGSHRCSLMHVVPAWKPELLFQDVLKNTRNTHRIHIDTQTSAHSWTT